MQCVRRGYRIRAYPNGAQRRCLDCWFGAARWLWNTTLAIRSEAYRERKIRLTGTDLSRWLTQWKRTTGHEWLADVPGACLEQCLRDQDAAFDNFFAHRTHYPCFKPKRMASKLRFRRPRVVWRQGVLSLPKLGPLRLAELLPAVPRPDIVTLTRDAAGRYHISFSAVVERTVRPVVQRSVGVDLGLGHLAVLSTGEKIPNPKRYQAHLRYLRQQQRCLARRQADSRRRERQRLKVARIHAKCRQERHDTLHRLTTHLVDQFDLICIEDLNVKAMARGRQARAIRDAAFSEMRRQLVYKSDWYGRVLVVVDRWYPSSKSCSECRSRLQELPRDERHWRCPKCGMRHDRDINAARNLLMEGLRQLAGRDDRDLRVDARGACPEESILEQVLAEEARSGYGNPACVQRAELL